MAQRAVGAVVVDTGGGIRGNGTPVDAEPVHVVIANGKAGGERVVGVEQQRYRGGKRRTQCVKHPFGMAVAGELVAAEVGDDEQRRAEIAEGVGSVALVRFEQQHIRQNASPQCGTAEDERCDALDLVGAFLIIDDAFSGGRQDGGDHLHGGGLAVGAGDGDNGFGQLHPRQHVGTDLQSQLAGQRATPPAQTADGAAEPTGEHSQKTAHGDPLLKNSMTEKVCPLISAG